jgi:rhodanese-related sulfurtransferase
MGLRTVAPADVLRLTREGRALALDVNSRESWHAAHVPGSVNLDPMSFVPGDLPSDKSATLVFYCSNPLCSKAPRAALRAKRLGYEDVRVMSAGIRGWISAGLPTESSPAR